LSGDTIGGSSRRAQLRECVMFGEGYSSTDAWPCFVNYAFGHDDRILQYIFVCFYKRFKNILPRNIYVLTELPNKSVLLKNMLSCTNWEQVSHCFQGSRTSRSEVDSPMFTFFIKIIVHVIQSMVKVSRSSPLVILFFLRSCSEVLFRRGVIQGFMQTETEHFQNSWMICYMPFAKVNYWIFEQILYSNISTTVRYIANCD
jgi:hypothetical protein